MKVGIFGGRFDPVHIGHIILARDVLEHLGLDNILFLLSSSPPHKEVSLSFESRLKLLEAAISPDPAFKVCTIEKELGLRKSYTALVLEKLYEIMPNDELYFIMGEDQFIKLDTWYMPEKIFEIARVVVLKRHEEEIKTAFSDRILYVNKRIIEVSSTEIRNRLKKGLPIRHLVPERVAEIIDTYNLYK